MSQLQNTSQGALSHILDSLEMTTDSTEKSAESDAFRIDFEHNFTVELAQRADASCRISARIFNLGKSLQVQEIQLKKAMGIFTELRSDFPPCASLAVSDHDNCLRFCIEIPDTKPDDVVTQFHEFVNLAFAYKHTYFKHKNDSA